MPSFRYLQLDVFTTQPGAGNPLAVVLDAQGLSDADMQAIARWTRLPETTFVLPATTAEASYDIRIFSPRREVPFAGHPSVGTAYAVLHTGFAQPQDHLLVQHGKAGLLPLRVQQQSGQLSIAVRTPRATLIRTSDLNETALAKACAGMPVSHAPIALMDGGRRWWLVEIQSEDAIRSIAPDWEAITALAMETDSMGVFAYAYTPQQHDYAIAARAFVGNPAAFEDAASGAANATLAAWLASQRKLPTSANHYRVSQGREVGYNAFLDMAIDDEGNVWSGGQVCPIVDGRITWPTNA